MKHALSQARLNEMRWAMQNQIPTDKERPEGSCWKGITVGRWFCYNHPELGSEHFVDFFEYLIEERVTFSTSDDVERVARNIWFRVQKEA
jgi:hypothetical protein